MIQELRKTGRLELSVLLSAMALFCFSMSIFRHSLTQSKLFLFLNWNLFLAFLPWVASTAVVLKSGLRKNRVALAALLGAWILFFPNSPYILTDLFHLQPRAGIPMWFDLVLILAFAWTGLAFGFVSLLDIESLLLGWFRKAVVAGVVVFLLFLSSFGIYLGRFLRWNSWDILHSPLGLFQDIGHRLAYPWEHSRTWGVTIFMGILLNMIYWTLKAIKKGHSRPQWLSPNQIGNDGRSQQV